MCRPVDRTLLLLVLAISVATVSAQQEIGTARPSFDVASVKPSPVSERLGDTITSIPGTFPPGGRFLAHNSPFLMIIRRAYQDFSLRPDQIVGPSWITEERYDIDARAADDTDESRVRLMLQQLLAERFKMKVHTETRMQDVYSLVMARADGRQGPQLRAPTRDCSKPIDASGAVCGFSSRTTNGVRSVSLQGRSIGNLVIVLTNTVGRTVIDRTGLSGLFDIDLEWEADDTLRVTSATSTAPPIFTALQVQLGLRLEPSQGPAEVLVIDHIERPTPN